MITSDKEIVQEFIAFCISRKIRHVVISPGSRNAPLVLAFNRNPFFNLEVVHDERSAGFIALGIIQATKEAAIVCCTSGSAVANYYPSVVEAFYRNLPLLVVSADRPIEWIDQGDGQTIHQKNIFNKHVLFNVNISDKTRSKNEIWMEHRELNKLFFYLKNGPCHVNISFEEPLYGLVEKEDLPKIPVTHVLKPRRIDEDDLVNIREIVLSTKTLVLLGQHEPNNKLNVVLQNLSLRSNLVVLVENTSNVSGGNIIPCIDRTLNMIKIDSEEHYFPETVLHMGGALVSKQIKKFIRKIPNKKIIRVSEKDYFEDTFQGIDYSVCSDTTSFLTDLYSSLPTSRSNTFSDKWKTLDILCRDKIHDFASKQSSLNDWIAYYFINQYLPNKCFLHLGNSSVVRYMQLFEPIHEINYFANRGTSGIDGSMSTAVGSAIAKPDVQHFLIIGDVSFIYDSNALWFEPFPSNLKVIIINNSGGGIFRIIDGPNKTEELEPFFEASHKHSCKNICIGFGKKCSQISELKDLEPEIIKFVTSKEGGFIEIVTEQKVNPKILESFFTFTRR